MYHRVQGSLEFAQQLEVLVGYLLPCIRAQASNLHGGCDGSQKGALTRMQVAALSALREYILYWCACLPLTLLQSSPSRGSLASRVSAAKSSLLLLILVMVMGIRILGRT